MMLWILTVIVCCKFVTSSEVKNTTFVFDNILQKISIRFKNIHDKARYFHFHGEKCTSYLYKKEGNFELITTNGTNHEIYKAPLDKKLYFEAHPFTINGNLMQLALKQGKVICSGFDYLTFLAEVTELIISDVEPSKVLYKQHSDHMELLSLLITIPLCIIILFSNRDFLSRKLGIKYSPTETESENSWI